jgi:hypothetical protein
MASHNKRSAVPRLVADPTRLRTEEFNEPVCEWIFPNAIEIAKLRIHAEKSALTVQESQQKTTIIRAAEDWPLTCSNSTQASVASVPLLFGRRHSAAIFRSKKTANIQRRSKMRNKTVLSDDTQTVADSRAADTIPVRFASRNAKREIMTLNNLLRLQRDLAAAKSRAVKSRTADSATLSQAPNASRPYSFVSLGEPRTHRSLENSPQARL